MQHYQKIIGITVETKKGASQLTRWLFSVYPSAMPRFDNGRWTDEGHVISQYGNARGFSVQYAFNLAAESFTLENAEGNRKDYAGYDGNTGTITYRGQDIGEMTVKFNDASKWGISNPDISVNGVSRPSESVGKFIEDQIASNLRKIVEANIKEFRLACVKVAKERMGERVKELQEELTQAKVEMKHYLNEAKKQA